MGMSPPHCRPPADHRLPIPTNCPPQRPAAKGPKWPSLVCQVSKVSFRVGTRLQLACAWKGEMTVFHKRAAALGEGTSDDERRATRETRCLTPCVGRSIRIPRFQEELPRNKFPSCETNLTISHSSQLPRELCSRHPSGRSGRVIKKQRLPRG